MKSVNLSACILCFVSIYPEQNSALCNMMSLFDGDSQLDVCNWFHVRINICVELQARIIFFLYE
jgi:Zn-finger protein